MPHPTVEPRLAAAAARLRTLRAELDRLDHQVDEFEPDARGRLLPRLVALRGDIDQLDADLEAEASRLGEQPSTIDED